MQPATTAVATPTLDEAFERMGSLDFELPNGFVNHGPMACEALAALGFDDEVDRWSRRFVRSLGEGPVPVRPRSPEPFDSLDALGDYAFLPEWIGYFGAAIDADGWRAVVARWIPRLAPGLVTALFHGIIRTAQAVRAIDAIDTPQRRAELARSLGYWSARFHPGRPVASIDPIGDGRLAVLGASAAASRRFLVEPTIFVLHGVTGAMALDLLLDHVDASTATSAIGQLRAEHASMRIETDVGRPLPTARTWDDAVAVRASQSRDVHQVKLVEACRRGFEATRVDEFAEAAERVGSRS